MSNPSDALDRWTDDAEETHFQDSPSELCRRVWGRNGERLPKWYFDLENPQFALEQQPNHEALQIMSEEVNIPIETRNGNPHLPAEDAVPAHLRVWIRQHVTDHTPTIAVRLQHWDDKGNPIRSPLIEMWPWEAARLAEVLENARRLIEDSEADSGNGGNDVEE